MQNGDEPMSYPELKMLIAGEWVFGSAGKSEPVICPADGSEIGQVPHASPADLDRALDSSREGFKHWRDN
jgi:succinate-semialdehyde dehydrogenase/glutarate-semialdehyde dehydrogenase